MRRNLREGRVAQLRKLGADDASALQTFVGELTPQARSARFFTALRRCGVSTLSAMLSGIGLNLAAFAGEGRMVAHAQYVLTGTEAEFALVVGEAWRRLGLGAHLIGVLQRHARRCGVRRLSGLILADNRPMLELVRKLRFALERSADAAVLRAVYAEGSSAAAPEPPISFGRSTNFGSPSCKGSFVSW